MFCKRCGSLVTLGNCPDCGKVAEINIIEVPHREGLSDIEKGEQEHIQRQRKKQEVWKIPDGEDFTWE